MTKTPSAPPVPGLLVVDKPAGWTSHDVVAKARGLLGTKKVGHAGTLDPMATGVLVLGVGKGTKLLTFVVGADKDYDATIRLGEATITDDAEGEVTAASDASGISDAAIAAAVADLTGDIQQVPSSVSAIKIDGQRSYARVRSGEDVEIPARPVTVSRFEILEVRRSGSLVDVDVAVTVSSGTYVRALARDLGAALGVGGHLTALRRTRVGGFGLDVAVELADAADAPVVPVADAARAVLPSREITAAEATEMGHGRRIPRVDDDGMPDADHPLALLCNGTLVALAKAEGDHLRPSVVFASPTTAE